jgi:DNA replication protein DnaC
MLIHPTIANLKTLKLFGMVHALEAQINMPQTQDMIFEDRLGLLVDTELTDRENRRLQTRLKAAKLRQSACPEDVDLKTPRNLDKTLWNSLISSQWITKHQNLLITGKTGVGKSYLACALAQKACRDGFTAICERSSRLFQDLATAKLTGNYNKLLSSIARKDVLLIDDFGLSPLTDDQRHDLLEIIEDRHDKRSTMITSQLPIKHWHEIIGDPTIADAILDRLVHCAHEIALDGETMRANKNKK